MDSAIIERLLTDVKDPEVRAAFRRVDRSRFVPSKLKASAWEDHPLPIEEDATISQPSLVAKMTEALEPAPSHKVLEIGTGSGYQAALLAELVASVHTIENNPRLSERAAERLEQLGYKNIEFRVGDGAEGWPEAAPFDRIIGTAAFPARPEKLLEQLADDGICLVPVGPPEAAQYLTKYRKGPSGIESHRLTPVRFLPMQ
ncbi:MAG: protein-L-isoaspartate(D-aspartate) O-methyltransferase [Opitutales bacterium]